MNGLEVLTITARHSALHDNDLFALPRVQDWHTRDSRTRFKTYRVHSVIRADDQCYIRVFEVVVNLVHLENDYKKYVRID